MRRFFFFFEYRLTLSFFFFFSSRRRHTRFDCDWSSDVCSSDLKNPAEEVFEFDTRRKVAAIGAEVDPAEDDFLISGFAEIPDFLNDGFRRKAPASSTHKRNHTVRAARVTPILNFQGRARVAPFPAEDRSGKQDVLFENVAAQDFCRKGGK